MKRSRLALLYALLLGEWGYCGMVAAEPAVAIFSSETGPYQEALLGLQEELKEDVRPFFLARGEPPIPPGTRVVLAFGSKAAMRQYPDRITLICAMVPGGVIQAKNLVKIEMEPDHSILLKTLKELDPKLKSMGVLWASPRFKSYISELRAAAETFGITIEDASLERDEELPDVLRRLHGRIGALWLLPDPLLVNAKLLPIFVQFSHSNKVPLFVPTAGLLDQGATASLGPSFREMGRQAGIAARKALLNQRQEDEVYPANIEIAINKAASARVGLQIPESVLRKADKVVP